MRNTLGVESVANRKDMKMVENVDTVHIHLDILIINQTDRTLSGTKSSPI